MLHRRSVPITALLMAAVGSSGGRAADNLSFKDVTAQSGLAFESHKPLPPALRSSAASWIGTGAAIADYDVDGDLDVYFVDTLGWPNQLWSNNGDKTFTNVSAGSGLDDTGSGRMALWLDLDNDGDPDIVVLNDTHGGTSTVPARIYRNDGAVFTDVTTGSGFDPTGDYAGGMAATDYNGDGLLDIYVTYWNDSSTLPPYNYLFRNTGNFTFMEETAALGLRNPNTQKQTWSPVFFDFDGDGDQDLYGAVDFDLDYLYLLGPDGFTDVSVAANVFHDGQDDAANDMGVAIGDIDGDGDQDMFTTNITFPLDGSGKFNALFVNNWPEPCTDEASAAERNVWRSFWGWGTVFADLDFDRDLDLVTVGGRTAGDNGTWADKPKQIFENDGTGRFEEVASAVGFDHTGNSRGLVAFDYDNDGDEDLLITNASQSIAFFENTTPHTYHYLKLILQGTARTREAIGAKVRATVDGRTQLREQLAGGSFLSGLPREMIFGLGEASVIEKLEVTWPCGTVTELTDVRADQTLTLVEDTLTRPPSLSIVGPANVAANVATSYAAILSFACGPQSPASDVVWTVDPPGFAAIDSSGTLSVGDIEGTQSVAISATANGMTVTQSITLEGSASVEDETPLVEIPMPDENNGDPATDGMSTEPPAGGSPPPNSANGGSANIGNSGGCGAMGLLTLLSCSLVTLGHSRFRRRVHDARTNSRLACLIALGLPTLLMVGLIAGAGCTGGSPPVAVTSDDDAPGDSTNDPPPADDEQPVADDDPVDDVMGDQPVDDPPTSNGDSSACDPPCGLGQVCQAGDCAASNEPQVQIGYTDEPTDVYTALPDGAQMPYFTLGQGGSHMFVTVRATGFSVPSDGSLNVTYIMFRQSDRAPLSGFEELNQFTRIDDGILESKRRVIFISEFPELIEDAVCDFTIVVRSPIDPTQTVTLEQTLVLDFKDE